MGKQNYEVRAMVDGKYQVKEIAASSEKDAENIFLDTLKAMGWENKECQILAVKEIAKTEEKDLEEVFEKLHKTAYEKYQLKWMISQGYSLSDVVGVMAACVGESAFEHEISEEEDAKTLVKDAYDGFLENGFTGSCIFVCMDEFLDAEYQDAEYMKFLLTEEEFKLWCREMDFTPDNVIASVDTPAGELIVRASGVYDDYPGISIEVKDGDDCSPAGCVFEYDEVKKALQCVVYRKGSHEPAELPPDETVGSELEKWIKKIETRRLEDWKDIQREQKELKSEYDSYVSRYRSYSYEEMRDYGHTWGPGCEPEEPEAELPEYYKIHGKQLAILKEMVQSECFCDADIEYIFLSKSGWDDEYKICKMREEYTMQDVLICLLKYYRCEADFYREKAKL